MLVLSLLLALSLPEPPGVAATAAGPQEMMRRLSMAAGARDYAGWVRDGEYDVTVIGDGLFGGVDIDLEAGVPYSMVAACSDCSAIEIEAFGPDGDLAGRGQPFGGAWLAEFRPERAGVYRLTVHPAGCPGGQCIIAFAHYLQPSGE